MSDDNGSFLAGLAESGNPADNGASAPAGAGGAQPAVPGANAPTPPPAQTGVKERPEWAKEKFWDAEKGEVRVEELATSYNQMEKYFGGDKIPVPKDPDDKLAWDMYWKAGGVPDSADAYQFSRPDLPANLPYDEAMEKSYRNWAHENHLNPQQAGSLHDLYVKMRVEESIAWENDRKAQREKAESDFIREHGKAAEGVKQGVGVLIKKYADPDFHQFLTETGLGNDPRFTRVFARINKDMGGVGKLHGNPSAEGPPRTAQELQSKIDEYRSLHHKALMNTDDPTHKFRTDQLFKLHEELAATRGQTIL